MRLSGIGGRGIEDWKRVMVGGDTFTEPCSWEPLVVVHSTNADLKIEILM
jgi:hypothetical protein